MKPLSGYKTMSKKDQVCCCNIFTGAAIAGILQFIVITLCLTTAGIVLDHWQMWKTDFQRDRDLFMAIPKQAKMTTTSPTGSTTTTTVLLFGTKPNATAATTTMFMQMPYPMRANLRYFFDVGLETFIQIHLAHHVAVYTVWLMFMVLYAWAFRTMRPILVLPNLIMQLFALVIMIILGGTLIARMVKLYRQWENAASYEDDLQMNDIEARYAFHAVLLACLVIVWFLELVFAHIGFKFYVFLHDEMQNMYPEHPSMSMPVVMRPRAMSRQSAGPGFTVNNNNDLPMATTNLA